MTTLIGIEYDDSCVLVADSRTTDSVGYIYSHANVKKISERNGYLIAGSGEVLPCDGSMKYTNTSSFSFSVLSKNRKLSLL